MSALLLSTDVAHVCACGVRYTLEAWASLPLAYVRHDDEEGWYEARHCPCGSTREVSLERYREERDADDKPVRCEHCDRLTRVTYEMTLGDYGPGLFCSLDCALVCGDCGKREGVRQAEGEHDGWILCRECELAREVAAESVLNSDNDQRDDDPFLPPDERDDAEYRAACRERAEEDWKAGVL